MDLTKILLPGWPEWLRLVMWGSVALWTVVYGYLAAFPPKAPPKALVLAELRQDVVQDDPGALLLFASLLNTTGGIVNVEAVRLEFFEDEIPEGGFASAESHAVTITIADSPQGLLASSGNGKAAKVALNAPYAGAPYVIADVPLSQVIKDQDSRQVYLLFPDRAPLDPAVNKLKATFRFGNGTQREQTIDIALP